jgi:serine/threonine-protein kinase
MGLSPGLFVAGRYRLDRLVGEGGMSWVWAATNVVTARPVALKFLKRPAARATDHFRRFLGEARATIPHRNVVQIYDLLYLEGDIPFMVMELLRGGTLRDELRRKGRLPIDAACAVLAPVVSALGCAHAAGVIHCDLKAENIFLAREDDGETTVKVLDFGLAKQLAADIDDSSGPVSRPRTRGSAPFGTIGYAAPEQGISSRVDHRADIWALGVVLFECLTGERPFPSDGWERYLDASSGGARKDLLADGSALRRRVTSGLPPSVAALIARMLSPEPSQRPSLKEVQAELQRYTTVRATSFGEPISIPPPPNDVDDDSTVSESDPIRPPEPSLPSLDVKPSPEPPPPAPRAIGRARRVALLSAAVVSLASLTLLTLLTFSAELFFLRPSPPDIAIAPEEPVRPQAPLCRATILHTLDDLETLANAMPLTVEACSGPRSECARFQVTLSPFACDKVESAGVGGVFCDKDPIEKKITIRREVESSTEGCDAWSRISGEIRDKHREPLRVQFTSDASRIDPPGPGAAGRITLTGRFQR